MIAVAIPGQIATLSKSCRTAAAGSLADERERRLQKWDRQNHTFHNKAPLLFGFWPIVSALLLGLTMK